MRSLVGQGQRSELAAVFADSRSLLWAVAAFSFFVNLLMLTGPLYMLNIYDRVLASRSLETLVALSLIAAFLFVIAGTLDAVRNLVMGRIGARFQLGLGTRIFILTNGDVAGPASENALKDLDAVQRLIASPGLLALFDLPWTVVFLTGLFIFHPALGMLGLMGGGVLMALALLNHLALRFPLGNQLNAMQRAEVEASAAHRDTGLLRALGMRASFQRHWQNARDSALTAGLSVSDRSGMFGAVSRSLRLLLQSAMLGLGAWLVLRDQLTPGAMIAASILLGRALAPVEQLIAHWPLFHRAREGRRRLTELLLQNPEPLRSTATPRPSADLIVNQLTVFPPGQAVASLRMISFALKPGQALGVIGETGSGKSTLAQALTGMVHVAGEDMRLGGTPLGRFSDQARSDYIGFLPQQPRLFAGTLRENIARFTPSATDVAVFQAARLADAHDMILSLPEGYDTMVTTQGGGLSGGQIQRVCLARAVFGDPVVLILDEPNAHLDNAGNEALNATVRSFRESGRIVLIMAHRPAAIQECDMLMVLDQGRRRAFGPRDDVLRSIVSNQAEIRRFNESSLS